MKTDVAPRLAELFIMNSGQLVVERFYQEGIT